MSAGIKAIITLILLLWSSVCIGEWERTYGGADYDEAYFISNVSDGGFIVSGYTNSFGLGWSDWYILRLDSDGDTVWARTYGGSEWEEAYCVRQIADGGFIVTGYTASFGAGDRDFYLVRTNSIGDTVWTRTYGGSDNDDAYSVVQTADGGFAVAGGTKSYGAGGYDFYLVRVNSIGDTIWTRTYGGSCDEAALSLAITSDGGFIMGGYTSSFGEGGLDFYLVRTDSVGDVIWTHSYGGSDDDGLHSVIQTADGGFAMAGGTQSFGAGAFDAYVVRIGSLGDTIWTRTFGGSAWDKAHFIAQTADGGFIVVGGTESFGAGEYDVYVIRLDQNGGMLWTHTYGGPHNDWAHSVACVADGGFVIAGYTDSFGAGCYDVYLVKIDADGVRERKNIEPNSISLTIYPNPFNSSVEIMLSTPYYRRISNSSPLIRGTDQSVSDGQGGGIAIYDIKGNVVATLSPLTKGTDADRRQGVIWTPDKSIPSGIYLVRATIPQQTTSVVCTKRIIYLK